VRQNYSLRAGVVVLYHEDAGGESTGSAMMLEFESDLGWIFDLSGVRFVITWASIFVVKKTANNTGRKHLVIIESLFMRVSLYLRLSW